jgi:hypothetical protein
MPQPKKASRPRLDAIIRHIKAGSYDDDMGQLQGAITDRQRIRQEAVLGMVKEVFGEDAYVDDPKNHPKTSPPSPGLDIEAAERQALANEERLRQEALSEGGSAADPLSGDDEAGIESRSPVIGSIDPSASEAEDAPSAA